MNDVGSWPRMLGNPPGLRIMHSLANGINDLWIRNVPQRTQNCNDEVLCQCLFGVGRVSSIPSYVFVVFVTSCRGVYEGQFAALVADELQVLVDGEEEGTESFMEVTLAIHVREVCHYNNILIASSYLEFCMANLIADVGVADEVQRPCFWVTEELILNGETNDVVHGFLILLTVAGQDVEQLVNEKMLQETIVVEGTLVEVNGVAASIAVGIIFLLSCSLDKVDLLYER